MTTFLPGKSLTQQELKELLDYEAETGIFRWRARPNNRTPKGAVAGSLSPEGYVRITIGQRRVFSHILAWLYMTGEYVVRGIDHKNTIRSDNRWCNLRRAGKSENRMNSRTRSDCVAGIKGVCVRAGRRPYAQITLPGQRAKYLGSFDTIEEAAEAYRTEAMRHFGEFARFK